MGYKEKAGWKCAHVAEVKWSIAEGELQWGLKQLRKIRNREVGHLREAADTWELMGKLIGSEQNWPC